MDNVFVYSPLRQSELVAKYNRAKLFVLLSYEEGMPKVLLEALACSVPVITGNTSGMKDIISNGKNGFFVDINNLEDIYVKCFNALSGKYKFYFSN